ncbi:MULTISPECIES: hypothetical protein [Caballeronia]|uniref:Uncharacterized protein n=1 Tax=Caballeronia jiangsuensis TaxID=1458357 RepID=A0ABW9CP94_9BURK|nr:hypothetical protein [Caballeronia sp. GaOx3]
MFRIIPYRGFEIHVTLAASSEDLYDVSFQIFGGSNLSVLGAAGRRIPLHNGPFTSPWSYLIAECAGQAAIDLLIGPPDNDA